MKNERNAMFSQMLKVAGYEKGKVIEMNQEYVMEGKNLYKKLKKFELNVESIQIPKGFATALIGENGAGKTTLLNILAGTRLDYSGELSLFGKYDATAREENPEVKEMIGYTGTSNYYLPHWTIKQIEEINQILFQKFDLNRFHTLCDEMAISSDQGFESSKKVCALSDGTKMKLMLANVLARDTNLLLLDEPASPLDPLMRDKLCDLMRQYLENGNGENSIFFSTHNIADMENVTDYAIIMSHGKIVEAGFVEDLKEKYIWIRGDAEDIQSAEKVMFSIHTNPYGFEGLCLAENLEQLAGLNVQKDIASLYQISVEIMKKGSFVKM